MRHRITEMDKGLRFMLLNIYYKQTLLVKMRQKTYLYEKDGVHFIIL